MRKTVFVCREDSPGGNMAGFCSEGSVVVLRRPETVATFATSAEALEFIANYLPGGLRNWVVERV